MYKRNKCIVCNGTKIKYKKSSISPFISEYLDIPLDLDLSLAYCYSCNVIFFDHEYCEIEHSKLYSYYRQKKYNQIRIKNDPSYENICNSFNEKKHYIKRLEIYNSFLDPYKHLFSQAKSILDFGGDNNLLFPNIFSNTKKFIFNISSLENENTKGCKVIKNLNEEKPFDAILFFQILEHVSNPVNFLNNIILPLIPSKGYIFLSVPGYRRTIEEFWEHIQNNNTPPQLNEHLQFFSSDSLKIIANKINCKCIDIKTVNDENLALYQKI